MLPIDFDKIPFLKNTGWLTRREIAKKLRWYSLPGGMPLFLEGEDADMLWFVRTGSLGAFRTLPNGETELVGYIRSGEPVGEMALIAGEKHSSSVYALRDSELFGLEKKIYNKLILRYPELISGLAKLILIRLRQEDKIRKSGNSKVYSFFSASPSIDILYRANTIAEEIKKLGKKTIVLGHEALAETSDYFDELERTHDIIILAAQLGQDSWSQICLRQADRIWIFGRTDAKPSIPLLPENSIPMQRFKLVDIVLLRDMGKKNISTAQEWSKHSGAARVFNWRQSDNNDLKSLARIIAGKSVGLILSGGGARAYAHIGAVRALREENYDFDFLSGTSMGGVIAGCVAMGWNDQEIEKHIWDAFVKSNPLNDYVLPVVSFASGNKVDERLEEHFGETLIEDLRRPFFCVSANLMNGKLKIHREGRLRDALRASIAIPGLLPPVANEDEILVDGATLNNFPVDIMATIHRGINIGVDVTAQNALIPDEFISPPNFFGWVIQHGIHSPPPIAELLMRAATVPITNLKAPIQPDILATPELGNIALRDWKAFDVAIEAGYNNVKEILKNQQLQ